MKTCETKNCYYHDLNYISNNCSFLTKDPAHSQCINSLKPKLKKPAKLDEFKKQIRKFMRSLELDKDDIETTSMMIGETIGDNILEIFGKDEEILDKKLLLEMIDGIIKAIENTAEWIK